MKIIILCALITCFVFIGAASAVNISLYEADPYPLPTNYSGILTATYLVESDTPLNFSTVAFLAGINYTLTGDTHSNIKVPANNIASEGVYRGHFRNTTPTLLWKDNTNLTEGNVWRWSGYDNNSAAIETNPINATHTWINVTGHTSIVFPSMYYLDILGMVSAPMTPTEINRAQGIIIKVWDVEHLRGRNNEYYVNLFFDAALEATPNANIDLWYCNASFDPLTDDPVTCEYCNRMDTWDYSRWMDKMEMQFHSNSSYTEPYTVNAGEHPDTPPDVINYIYLTSPTVASKSYVLNTTNYDPNVCNLTYAQTNTMWLRNEISGINTPYAYTPSFYMTFVRDYLEFDYSLHIADTNGTWGYNFTNEPIGLSNIVPTHTKYNYFWWDNTTDYNMTGSYNENFWVNVTFGFDPDNGAELTHIISLYDSAANFIATINSSLIGSNNNTDIFFNLESYSCGYYRFRITSTDNENSHSFSCSQIFKINNPTKFTTGALAFFNELQNGLEGIRDNTDKYLVWGVISVVLIGCIGLFGFITAILKGRLH